MEQKGNPITEGVIWKQILLFFAPVAMGTFFQYMYNTADALIVGRYLGMDALAAVGGVANHVTTMILGFFVALSSGASVIIAQYYGAENKDAVSRGVHTAAALALSIGAFLTVVGILFVPQTLHFLNQPEDLMADSVIYMRIYFAGIIPTLVYNLGSGILRAIGDSRRPMIYLIISCFTNILLDLLFVAVFPFGVAGAGIATALSQLISAALVTLRLMRTKDCYRLHLPKIRFHKIETVSALRIGLPAALQSLAYSFTNTFILSQMNLYGKATVSAWTVLGKIDGIVWLILEAFGIAVTTFAGQNFGAKREDRVLDSIRVSNAMAATAMVVLSAALMAFGRSLFPLFGCEGEVLEIGMRMLRLFVPYYVIFVPIQILSGAMRGVGKPFVPMLISCFGICAFRTLFVIVTNALFHSVDCFAISYPVSWIVSAVAYLIYYKYGHWLSPGERVGELEVRIKKEAKS